MKSKEILNVLGVAKDCRCRPSTLLDITDAYTAYCFDEACTYISEMINKGLEPVFERKYSSFSDMYKEILR